jgi:CheY-like chemotaxis protein
LLLPKLEGQQVLQMLQADAATAHIPVIASIGLTQPNEAKLMQAGAAGYFEKSRFEDSLVARRALEHVGTGAARVKADKARQLRERNYDSQRTTILTSLPGT